MWLKIEADRRGLGAYRLRHRYRGRRRIRQPDHDEWLGRLSDETLWQEGQRRGILGPQFDGAKEKTLVAANVKTRVAQMTDPKTGQLINQGGGAE
jgi:hypothetical protein